MTPLQLTESGKHLLTSYPWPGNIRQLKNITEQISLLSEQREITEETLRQYLPEVKSSLPMLTRGEASNKGQTFESEREIMYQILFDMRRDMTELKNQVNTLMSGNNIATPASTTTLHGEYPTITEHRPTHPTTISISSHKEPIYRHDYQDTEEYVEETLSLEDAEKKLISEALIRCRGKRKKAAEELRISERTLYRKIKEYNL